ncbi:MAG: GH39 family glycosyl hydrolase [Planctomycetota bacterium]
MSATVSVDCGLDNGACDHFWRGTGFTPAKLLLEAPMRQTIAQVGAIPHGGIRHVRIHYLLDLVGATGLGTDAVAYDWSQLDQALDVLVDNGLCPFFELMGNVAGFFDDYKNPVQATAWRDMVQALAEHLFERYDRAEVESWYFETWNEPDLPWWSQDIEAFCIYYDACSEGLRAASSAIRFGGPGICETLHPLFTGLIAHCDSGTNYFTGETGVRIDFISAHEKGGKWSNEAVSPNTDAMLERTLRTIAWIREHHPRLGDVPFFNDEADPLIGWKQRHSWRGWPYYAATVCRWIDLHQRVLREQHDVPFGFLSNDNGFLGDWGQRSQLCRFGRDQDLEQGRFELIKKPVLNVMTALALLGDRRIGVTVAGAEHVGAVASRQGEQIAVLVYHSRDKVWTSGSAEVRLELTGLTQPGYRLAHYRIDETHSNPFRVWEENNYPDFPHKDPAAANYPDTPDVGLFAQLRDAAELELDGEPVDLQSTGGRLELRFPVQLHAVSLLLFTPDPGVAPAAPRRLRALTYPGLTPGLGVMLRWDGNGERGVRSYAVEYAPPGSDAFERVNRPDLLACGWYHQRATAYPGRYRVRAIDYWGRSGEASAAITV